MRRYKKPLVLAAEFVLLTAISLFFILPILWIVASALRPSGPLYTYANPLTLQTFFPTTVTFDNFVHIFKNLHFGRALLNSLLVAVATIAISVLICSMAGFGLAKFAFRGKNLFFFIVLITFMVPFESIVIPLFVLVKRLNIDNTYFALILPAAGNGLAIFLFRQFFSEVPTEILEAARIDGASWIRIFRKIILPLSIPAIVTVIVMVFMFQWNSLFWPLIATHSSRFEVVQVAITAHRSTEDTSWANLFSSAIAGSLPPVILFFFLQKYFVRGISGTGLKG
ncbi:MAG TPA: carbohydrate ABC transporter permease [Thermotogota bacterium]|nr:carbohydrate ABC transporter permease [Thermotogota bacterium]HOM54214.1 carbohydrate ABC transporter permease [Thermotogota bacterium]HOS23775.1 carbohydrate ABC transporter permease [Thermotogota bacterium]HOT87066.1 carbohydrate ABC transporter permease [Thermotogota bacterium]HOX64279.1 carbohydrate ABC transporter permease [Thermotogota bacterium]